MQKVLMVMHSERSRTCLVCNNVNGRSAIAGIGRRVVVSDQGDEENNGSSRVRNDVRNAGTWCHGGIKPKDPVHGACADDRGSRARCH